MSDGLAARRAALSMVEAVLEHDRGLDECADATAGLEPRDRAFA
ncbi:MAG: rRNA methyltransferase, partial [Alphaproteobacteria bacterium]|nr:rRNA methyltransferase [Alphaproteobacteria bacterium]